MKKTSIFLLVIMTFFIKINYVSAKASNKASEEFANIVFFAYFDGTESEIKEDIKYYQDNSKKLIDNPSGYYKNTKTITLKKTTREGYTFKGWYKDSKYKKKITSIKKGSTGNKTLYAKWESNKYTIKFNSNGGTGKMSSLTKRSYGKSYKLTSNKYKRKGYEFLKWNTKADGTGTSYKNKASVKNLVSKNKGSITLYAIWKEK